MKAKKTLIKYINELGNLGLLHYEEHKQVMERINNKIYLRGVKECI